MALVSLAVAVSVEMFLGFFGVVVSLGHRLASFLGDVEVASDFVQQESMSTFCG
jgi:hypothetical protein